MSDARLTPEQAAAVLGRAVPIPASRGASSTKPAPFVLDQPNHHQRVDVEALDHRVLLLFVSANCEGCTEVLTWPRDPVFFGLAASDEVVVVVRSAAECDELGGDLWVSEAAFGACQVSGAPFFVLLDPAFVSVATEGVIWGLDSVTGALARAIEGAPSVEVGRLEPPR